MPHARTPAKCGAEFRCKWSKEDGNASLKALSAVFDKHVAALKAIEGVKSVKRVVCGGCQVSITTP